LHAISTLLKRSPAYKNVISLGHVLDEKGEKMSKSKGNVIDPWSIVEKYGSDTTRWYFYTVNQPGDSKLFREKEVEECLKRFLITFWNCYLFFETYKTTYNLQLTTYNSKNTLDYNPPATRQGKILDYNPPTTRQGRILDKWIISKLNELIQQVTKNLDKYEVTFAGRNLENFVIEDLSLWYIRRSRRRFQKPESERELKEASETLNYVLLTLSKLTAPFIPFLSEEIYRKIVDVKHQQSVHLEDWPKVNKRLIDQKLNQGMEKTRRLVTLALAERARSRIKVRQPLNTLKIGEKLDKDLLALLKEEVNVKKVEYKKGLKDRVELDTKITPELKEEGVVREVIRQIQEMRKKAGFKPEDKILIQYFGVAELNDILNRNRLIILKETKAKDFWLGERPKQVFEVEREVKINGMKLWLAIKKI